MPQSDPSRDLVIGIDASTTAVKAIAFDRHGTEIAVARSAYPTSNPAPGFFEQDAEDWWRALVEALRALGGSIDMGRVASLTIGHQRETFVLVDSAGKPTAPAILWLDERSRRQVQDLSARLGRDRIRDLSGKPPDPTPALYGLAWLAEHRPDIMASAHKALDVQGFLTYRLLGRFVTSTASADPLGLLDIAHGQWDPDLTQLAGLRPDQLPALAKSGAILGAVAAATSAVTGLVEGTLVVAGAGDGQLAGLGVGVVDEQSAYLSLGSGVVSGMFGHTYRTSEGYRTLTSPTGDGYMFETVLRSGMTLVDWAVRLLADGKVTPAAIARLETAARSVPVGSGGLMLLPYWAGVMNPYWDESAKGMILGLTLDHTAGDIFRAVLEGIAMEQAIATQALEASIGHRAGRFIACGGGVQSTLLPGLMAAMLGRPLAISPVTEAGALGAATLAAMGAGWYASAGTAVAAMVASPTVIIQPDEGLGEAYRPLLAVYGDVFSQSIGLLRRLRAATSER